MQLLRDIVHSYGKRRAAALIAVSAVSITGIAVAAYRTIQKAVIRTGTETHLNVVLNVPYGNFTLQPGTKAQQLALLQVQTEDMENDPPMHYRQTMRGTIATLKLTLGTDEGMLLPERPIVQGWTASGGLSLASTNAVRTDYGAIINAPEPYYGGRINSYASLAKDNDRYQLNITKDVPITMNAIFGFGESSMDWTGLSIATAFVETGASDTKLMVRSPNPIPMNFCKVNAGVGSVRIDGICNMNTSRFDFSGGVGYYKLNFGGKLSRNLDANVEVGMGKVSIDIPPDAGRVQVYYDDSFFSSFSFSGLNKRRDGYVTSVGFDQSTAPILTLRLSTGMGKMEVRYR